VGLIDDISKPFREIEERFTAELHTRADFVKQLLEQDDWSFVIKSHALIETAVSQMIITVLGENRLGQFIEKMPLNSKITVAESLELLDAKQIRFVRWFSKLRNRLVHRFENLGFTFEKHMTSMTADELKQWKKEVVWFETDPRAIAMYEEMAGHFTKDVLGSGILRIALHCTAKASDAVKLRANKEIFGGLFSSV